MVEITHADEDYTAAQTRTGDQPARQNPTNAADADEDEDEDKDLDDDDDDDLDDDDDDTDDDDDDDGDSETTSTDEINDGIAGQTTNMGRSINDSSPGVLGGSMGGGFGSGA